MSPVAGLKAGDRVRTPSGKLATVVRVYRKGAERALVEYDDPTMGGRRTFRTAALRLVIQVER